MSDLQDIIVSSSVKAFNSGLAHGVIQERERIVELLKLNQIDTSKSPMSADTQVLWHEIRLLLAELIKGEQK